MLRTVFRGEAGHQRRGVLGELVDGDKVILPQSLEDVEHDVLGDLLPQSRHRAGGVEQDDHVLGRGSRLDVP